MKPLAFITTLLTIVIFLSLTTVVLAQDNPASSSAVEQSLTQSIKDRIKKIATQSALLTPKKKKIAFIGSIQKIANDTLTIKTADEIKLASVSATTTYVRMPGSKSTNLEEISIGDFAVGMGFINGSEVLETHRMLLYDKAPEPTKKTAVAGTVAYVDEDENSIVIRSQGEEVTLELTRTTNLALQTGVEKKELVLTDLVPGQYVAAIYIPVTDQYAVPKALTLLATQIIQPLTPLAPPDVATPSSTTQNTPPELNR